MSEVIFDLKEHPDNQAPIHYGDILEIVYGLPDLGGRDFTSDNDVLYSGLRDLAGSADLIRVVSFKADSASGTILIRVQDDAHGEATLARVDANITRRIKGTIDMIPHMLHAERVSKGQEPDLTPNEKESFWDVFIGGVERDVNKGKESLKNFFSPDLWKWIAIIAVALMVVYLVYKFKR